MMIAASFGYRSKLEILLKLLLIVSSYMLARMRERTNILGILGEKSLGKRAVGRLIRIWEDGRLMEVSKIVPVNVLWC
jgi:hypothetical protein